MAFVRAPAALELRHGIAIRAMPGEAVCGDVAVAARHGDDYLIAAIDGIGHGEAAYAAARLAADVLEKFAGEPIPSLIERCHVALQGTRGVALAVAAINAASRRMTWLGVGNVQGVLQRRTAGLECDREVLMQRAGLVGARLPRLYASTTALQDGDRLAFATDGLTMAFVNGLVGSRMPQDTASRTLELFAQPTDDALVIVAEFGEGPP